MRGGHADVANRGMRLHWESFDPQKFEAVSELGRGLEWCRDRHLIRREARAWLGYIVYANTDPAAPPPPGMAGPAPAPGRTRLKP
jgi:hypothetical protein